MLWSCPHRLCSRHLFVRVSVDSRTIWLTGSLVNAHLCSSSEVFRLFVCLQTQKWGEPLEGSGCWVAEWNPNLPASVSRLGKVDPLWLEVRTESDGKCREPRTAPAWHLLSTGKYQLASDRPCFYPPLCMGQTSTQASPRNPRAVTVSTPLVR